VAARSIDASVDTSGWLTRQQAADLLDVSHTTIKNWDGGLLHPRKEVRALPNGGSREIWLYDPAELARVPAARRQRAKMIPGDRGEVSARAFELFDEGLALREVVTRLRETPETVEAMHDQWSRMGGSELVINPVARCALVALVGPFDGVAGLVAAVREALRSAAVPPLAPALSTTPPANDTDRPATATTTDATTDMATSDAETSDVANSRRSA
jgi:hypothetical protein